MYLGLLVSASPYSCLLGSQLCCDDKTATDNFRALRGKQLVCAARKKCEFIAHLWANFWEVPRARAGTSWLEMSLARLAHEHGQNTSWDVPWTHTVTFWWGTSPARALGRVHVKGRNPKLHVAVWKQVIWLHQTILSKGKLEVLAPFLWTLIVLIEDDSKEEPFSQGITLSCFPEDNFTSLKQKAMEASHPLQNSIYRIHIKPIHLNEINLSSLSL